MANLKLGDWVIDTPEMPGTVVPGITDVATILGTEYPTVIMPDGKEWMAADLEGGNGIAYSAANPVTGKTSYFWTPTEDSLGALATQLLALPDGWRIPPPEEAEAMLLSVGPDDDYGVARVPGMRDNVGWTTPIVGAVNSTGFTALGNGRKSFGDAIEFAGQWYTMAVWPVTMALEYVIGSGGGFYATTDDQTNYGKCVRLVRDYTPPPIPPTHAAGTHDILVASGLAETTDSLAQRIDIRLRTFLGEHWLNPELGIPWFRDYLTKAPDLAVCRQVLWDTIMGVRGVQSINRLDLSINKSTRVLTVTFAVNGTDSFTSTITV